MHEVINSGRYLCMMILQSSSAIWAVIRKS